MANPFGSTPLHPCSVSLRRTKLHEDIAALVTEFNNEDVRILTSLYVAVVSDGIKILSTYEGE